MRLQSHKPAQVNTSSTSHHTSAWYTSDWRCLFTLIACSEEYRGHCLYAMHSNSAPYHQFVQPLFLTLSHLYCHLWMFSSRRWWISSYKPKSLSLTKWLSYHWFGRVLDFSHWPLLFQSYVNRLLSFVYACVRHCGMGLCRWHIDHEHLHSKWYAIQYSRKCQRMYKLNLLWRSKKSSHFTRGTC